MHMTVNGKGKCKRMERKGSNKMLLGGQSSPRSIHPFSVAPSSHQLPFQVRNSRFKLCDLGLQRTKSKASEAHRKSAEIYLHEGPTTLQQRLLTKAKASCSCSGNYTGAWL